MKRVVVLMGGWTAESEVSRLSGQAVVAAATKLRYDVLPLEFTRSIASDLAKLKPDVVFIALHGTFGEDGRVQGMLDILNIPYTHSGLLASAIGMDKILSKSVLSTAGLDVTEHAILHNGKPAKIYGNKEKFARIIKHPFIIKPINEGSSVGVILCKNPKDFDFENWKADYSVMMIEPYIDGKELNVAIVEDLAIGVIEVKSKKEFYDYEAKYSPGLAEHIMPADISPELYKQALDAGLAAHKAIAARGISRPEFRYGKVAGDIKDRLYIMEINTHPGFTPLSLVPEVAGHCGISFEQIVQYLIENAICGT